MELAVSAESVELGQLAEALTRQGYHAAVITPAPYLAIDIPGAALPYMIYNSGGHFWWHAAQVIGPSAHIRMAAELIIWGLRAHFRDPAGHDAASTLSAIPGSPIVAPPHQGPAEAVTRNADTIQPA
jgi:hypothetical protein